MVSPDPAAAQRPVWSARHLAGLLLANFVLALGPWLVRLADTGPVAAGFWRLTLALPVLLFLAMREQGGLGQLRGRSLLLLLGAGLFFGLDLASWHWGIERTKLGNAALFGNSGSVILMLWGLITSRRAPRLPELTAILAALAGAALLMEGSLDIGRGHFVGDLASLLAGVFYAFYILLLNVVRKGIGPMTVLSGSMLVSAPVMLGIALMLGETIMPRDWTPVVVLAFSSQVLGQGLLVYSLRHFTPLVIGLALLTQPAISALAGWLAFGETLSASDIFGMVLLAIALATAKAASKD